MHPYLVTIQTAETYANWRTFASSTAEAKSKVCPVCEKEDCECDDSHGYAKSMEPTFDPFYKEEAPIDMSSYETDYADEVDEMSEQEIAGNLAA
jgi:hypothetical protein